MSNETPSTETGAMPASGLPEMGTPHASQGAMPEAGSGEDLKAELDKLKHSYKNAQEELDRHRKNAKKLTQYEEAEKQAKEAQLSEIERTQKAYNELKATHDAHLQATQAKLVRYEVEAQAARLGIIDPEAAAMLLDTAKLEFDENGTPTNATKLLEALIKARPYLAPKQEEAPALPPATPAQPAQAHTPALPAMNPGRSTIAAPNATTPGKIPSWNDIYKR